MLRKNKNLIDKIKILKSIKADEAFKFNLRKKIIEETGIVTNINFNRLQEQQGMSTLRFIINNLYKNKNMFIPLLLIAALLGSGAGATYASQSSLPGDALYPIKIASEKVQTALVINDAKEADLHLKFSSERLAEVEELSQKGEGKSELIKLAVDNYKAELAEVKEILNSMPANTAQTAQIAQSIADSISQNKIVIAKVSERFDKNDDALDELEEAWEEATEHNDVATIALLKNSDALTQNSSVNVDTSSIDQSMLSQQENATTSNAIIDLTSQTKVLNKISEANHKIAEAEKYIAKKEQKNIDVAKAKEQIGVAKIAINDAQDLLSQNRYSDSFLKAKEAHKTAEMAKKSAEDNYKERGHDDNDEDDETIFLITPATNTSPAMITNQAPDTSVSPTTTDNTSSIINPSSGSDNANTSTPTTTTTNNYDSDDNDRDDNDNDRDDEDHDDSDNNDERDH